MDIQQLSPATIPQPRGLLSRADDVGEKHGGQHPLGLGNTPDAGQELLNQVEDKLRRIPDNRPVSSGKFDEPRTGDMLDQVASMLDGEELEVPSVQKKRWRLDQRQQRTYVALHRDRKSTRLD